MPKGHDNDSKDFVLIPSTGTSNLGGENEKAYIFNKKDIVEASKGEVEYLDEKLVDYPKIITIIEESNVTGSDYKVNREVVIGKIDYHVDDILNDEVTQLLKLQLEERFHRQEIERIAEENVSLENKLFIYPPVVTPDQEIEVFLNKSLSTLCIESDIFIKGGFNDWRWKPFTERLNKSDLLGGDWWSCRLHVPKEAYRVDFVLFNGKSVYDNNDEKDFSIHVDGGITAFEFEDFLLEEKRIELEKLATEQAEKEEQEKIARKIEAEKAAREEDRSLAMAKVESKKKLLQKLTKNAVRSVKNLWYIEPIKFGGKSLVRLYYNRKSGPLAKVQEVWLHGGYNDWMDKLSFVKRLVKIGPKDGDWWCADVVVPEQAIVIDWVFANGPPRNASVYDNNNGKDFRALVNKSIPDEKTWIWEQERTYIKLQEQRRLREEALAVKVEKTAIMKAETKNKTLQRFLHSQKHVVFTQPLRVEAGSTITVLYNPCNTILNGKPEVWFTHSFNRWTHRNGLFPPQKMLSSNNETYVKTSVKVPLDAYMIDFVFSDKEDGGVFDNNNTMDYHIPVSGSIVKETTMHIVHISVEMAPIAKVGGLGDVVTSLSRAIEELDHHVDIILPKYDCLNLSNVKDFRYHRNYFWNGTEIKVWHGKVEGLSVYFLEPHNDFFRVGRIYGCENDAERFGFFCHAALEYLFQDGFQPDIIHCHDWSSAPVTWLCKEQYRHCNLSKAGVVFTIHNLEFGAHLIGKAMAYTNKATTVSPTYSREVCENPAIGPHFDKFHGILNGIDPDIWDPFNDKFLPISYTSENVVEGKKAAKEALQDRLGLKRVDRPLLGVISRLTHQKGIHLIKHAIHRTLERGGQVVLLGSAPDPCIQKDFENLANELHSVHHDRVRLCLVYDEPLSHLIYAGADFVAVPSIFEPCGLTQLIAMRYGSIPVVRKTGGLYDTVYDVDHDKDRAHAQDLEPNGFSFDGSDATGVDYALNRAISRWYEDRNWFDNLCKTVMEQDWSWNRPALDYLELYHVARKAA
ncbi:soluble starch synthase 3, chloroplastic/amyloplastic-like [Vigna unguiculata]|uniref:soluble starch synthase 3, chloroplastic/amyloplastic-like n=1 Tax=Vigna unguiculata TaxID=3917 RepID=UPI001015D557|nr:soluble starch synthase 3, chloroplastic/amyloplastic-like [Vigna unguiculata]